MANIDPDEIADDTEYIEKLEDVIKEEIKYLEQVYEAPIGYAVRWRVNRRIESLQKAIDIDER